MLTVRPAQLSVFTDRLFDRLVAELRPALVKRYPHCLAGFPEPTQTQIVLNLLGRAKRQQITWESALVGFAEIMLAVAPNFDLHPAVRAVFGLTWLDPNEAMLSLHRRLSRDEWKSVAANAQDLPLFVPPRLLGASLFDQTRAALPLALGDKLDGAPPWRTLVPSSLALADELGLGRLCDGGLVLAAWRVLYGPPFRDPKIYPWVADVFDGTRGPAEILAMLKYRISLDHGCFI